MTLLDYNHAVLATYEIEDASQTSVFEIASADFTWRERCLDPSTDDKDLAKSAMYSCDESMSLLLGLTTSVGTLRAIADIINDPEKGIEYMPGKCCMDVATNSDFFGYRVSVARGSQTSLFSNRFLSIPSLTLTCLSVRPHA